MFGGMANVFVPERWKDIGPVCGVEEFSVAELRSEIVWRLQGGGFAEESPHRIPSGLLQLARLVAPPHHANRTEKTRRLSSG